MVRICLQDSSKTNMLHQKQFCTTMEVLRQTCRLVVVEFRNGLLFVRYRKKTFLTFVRLQENENARNAFRRNKTAESIERLRVRNRCHCRHLSQKRSNNMNEYQIKYPGLTAAFDLHRVKSRKLFPSVEQINNCSRDLHASIEEENFYRTRT